MGESLIVSLTHSLSCGPETVEDDVHDQAPRTTRGLSALGDSARTLMKAQGTFGSSQLGVVVIGLYRINSVRPTAHQRLLGESR